MSAPETTAWRWKTFGLGMVVGQILQLAIAIWGTWPSVISTPTPVPTSERGLGRTEADLVGRHRELCDRYF